MERKCFKKLADEKAKGGPADTGMPSRAHVASAHVAMSDSANKVVLLFYIDSGATDHMYSEKDLFEELRSIAPRPCGLEITRN